MLSFSAPPAAPSASQRGDRIPGFGHSLYPECDSRGAELFRLVAGEVLDLIGERPTVDFGTLLTFVPNSDKLKC